MALARMRPGGIVRYFYVGFAGQPVSPEPGPTAQGQGNAPDVPVIMITAYGDPETKRKAIESGRAGC